MEDLTGPAESVGRTRMWHAAWRQHRSWVVSTLALAVVGALLLVAAVTLVPACASTPSWHTDYATCSVEPAKTFWKLFMLGMLVLPVLVGVLLGAVTFGADVDSRSQIFALTQGVSRQRWWAVKVVVMTAPVFFALALLGLATLQIVNASDDAVISTNRLTSPGFDLMALVPATRFLVAYAAAATAALVWRTVSGLVIGLVVAGVVIAGGTLLQPLVVPHQRDLIPIDAWLADTTGQLEGGGPGAAYHYGGYTDAAGREVNTMNFDCNVPDFNACLATHVIYRSETYVSDAQFPQMTLIISGLDVTLAGSLLGWGARRLRRRDLG